MLRNHCSMAVLIMSSRWETWPYFLQLSFILRLELPHGNKLRSNENLIPSIDMNYEESRKLV